MAPPDDPEVSDARVRRVLAEEMRPRLDAIEAAAVFAAQAAWPYGHVLPVKREVAGQGFETGVLVADGRPVVSDVMEFPIAYLSFEDMAKDGWRPD